MLCHPLLRAPRHRLGSPPACSLGCPARALSALRGFLLSSCCSWALFYLVVIFVVLVQRLGNTGDYSELCSSCLVHSFFYISLVIWSVKSFLKSYSYDLLFFTFLFKSKSLVSLCLAFIVTLSHNGIFLKADIGLYLSAASSVSMVTVLQEKLQKYPGSVWLINFRAVQNASAGSLCFCRHL